MCFGKFELMTCYILHYQATRFNFFLSENEFLLWLIHLNSEILKKIVLEKLKTESI